VRAASRRVQKKSRGRGLVYRASTAGHERDYIAMIRKKQSCWEEGGRGQLELKQKFLPPALLQHQSDEYRAHLSLLTLVIDLSRPQNAPKTRRSERKKEGLTISSPSLKPELGPRLPTSLRASKTSKCSAASTGAVRPYVSLR